MNKFLTFLATGFIAILSVFSVSGNTKNAAEPQYFLENKKIQNAIVYNNNELNVYLSETAEFGDLEYTMIASTTSNTEFYTFNNENTKSKINLDFSNSDLMFMAVMVEQENQTIYASQFILQGKQTTSNYKILINRLNYNEPPMVENKRSIVIQTDFDELGNATNSEIYEINGFTITNIELYSEIQTLKSLIDPLIGNLTQLPTPPTPTNSLDQIGNIIRDTIDWFINIYSGLSNVFYSNGTLSVWGNVLFIGVAIYLVSMCLVWVISLIKGI